MPSEFDLSNQYVTARKSAAIFDLTGWTILRLVGRDCVKFLHNFCTADIKALGVGTGCEAFLTNVKARVIGHTLVFADAGDNGTKLTLVSSPNQASLLVPHLDRYVITEDVTITDLSSDATLIYLVGPTAEQSLKDAVFAPPGAASDPHRFTSTSENDVTIRRADILDLPGFLLEIGQEALRSDFRVKLASTGAVHAAPEIFDLLRIEAGYPLVGHDVSDEHLAPEVGRPWAISYTKGCYLGQEPIARIDALGHVNRELSGILMHTDTLPEPGSIIVADGNEIGVITSVAKHYGERRAVALAYLKSKYAKSDTTVVVSAPDGSVTGVVYRPK